MKKIIFLFIVVFLFSSCQNFLIGIVNKSIDHITIEVISGQKLFYGPFPDIKTIPEVATYIRTQMTHTPDNIFTPVAGPEESLIRGYGDCDEFTLAFMNIAKVSLDIEFGFATLLLTYNEDSTGGDAKNNLYSRAIEEGGFIDHSTPILDGQIYDVYSGYPVANIEAAYSYSFREVFTDIDL